MKKIVADPKRYLWKISSSDIHSKELQRFLTVCQGTRIIFHRRIRLAAILKAELNAWDKCLAISDVLRKTQNFSPLEWYSIFVAHFLVSKSRDLRKFSDLSRKRQLNSNQAVRGPGALFYQFEEDCTFLCTICWTISILVYMNLQRASKMANYSVNKSFNNCTAFLIWWASFGPFLKTLHYYLYILISFYDLRKRTKNVKDYNLHCFHYRIRAQSSMIFLFWLPPSSTVVT